MRASCGFHCGQLILVPVRIEAKRTCRRWMVLDTGAQITMITPNLAAEAGIELTGNEPKVPIVGVTGSESMPLVALPRVSLLGMFVENLEAVCHPLPPRLGLDGILGINFLQHFNLFIHHDTETVSLEKI